MDQKFIVLIYSLLNMMFKNEYLATYLQTGNLRTFETYS